jgi:hypothetical protein
MGPSQGPSGTSWCRRPMFGFPTRIVFLHPTIPLASAILDAVVCSTRALLASRDRMVLREKILGGGGGIWQEPGIKARAGVGARVTTPILTSIDLVRPLFSLALGVSMVLTTFSPSADGPSVFRTVYLAFPHL